VVALGSLARGALVGVRNRVTTVVNWFWSYITFRSAVRLITGMETRELRQELLDTWKEDELSRVLASERSMRLRQRRDGVVAFLGRPRQLIGRVSNARGQPPPSAGMHATIVVGYEIHMSLPLLSTTE
jgi:hypothetical protein